MTEQELKRENAFLKYLLGGIVEVVNKRNIFSAGEEELFETLVGVKFYANDYQEFLLKGKSPMSKGLY